MSDLTASAQQTDAGATGGTQPGAGTPPAPQPEAPKFTQDDVNRMIADEKRKLKQQQDEAATKIKREAEEKAALEKGEFEKLANERGARLQQVEAEAMTATERISAYEAEMERQFKARLKALPEEIREMEPGGDMLTRFAWLPKAEAAAVKLAATPVARPILSSPGGPRGTGHSTTTHGPDLAAQKRASGDYSL
jgi:hypothetical protein